MKRIMIFLLIFFVALIAACGETENSKPNGSGKSLKIFKNEDAIPADEQKENIEEESNVEETQKFVEEEEEDEDEEEEEEQTISPFPTTIASFNIPPDVLNIIKNEPRKPNITNFIVDLGDDSLFIQNAYKLIKEIAWRNNYYGVLKKRKQ